MFLSQKTRKNYWNVKLALSHLVAKPSHISSQAGGYIHVKFVFHLEWNLLNLNFYNTAFFILLKFSFIQNDI